MVERKIRQLVKDRLKHFPAVALLGPRQVGKTTLAKTLSPTYYDLELEEEKVRVDLQWPDLIDEHSLVVLDEAQNYPEIFPRIRSAIDARRNVNGRFLILGSISPQLMTSVADILTGRIAICELTPFSIQELEFRSEDPLWLMGGYPDGGTLGGKVFPTWQQNYLDLMAMRDLPVWGLPARPQIIKRLFNMLAATHGNVWNASQIGKSLGLSYHTVNSYLDYLQSAYLVRLVSPFHTNLKKRLVKSPKVYWRDSGLLHCLLNISEMRSLLNHPSAGFTWEGWVIEQLMIFLINAGIHFDGPYYFRTRDGHELDLVIRFGGALWGIEIKLTTYPGTDDLDKLTRSGGLINADRMALISKTKKSVTGTGVVSTNLRNFLQMISG